MIQQAKKEKRDYQRKYLQPNVKPTPAIPKQSAKATSHGTFPAPSPEPCCCCLRSLDTGCSSNLTNCRYANKCDDSFSRALEMASLSFINLAAFLSASLARVWDNCNAFKSANFSVLSEWSSPVHI